MPEKTLSRRIILNLLFALSLVPSMLDRSKPVATTEDEFVEVNGWILKKSDLA